MDPNDRRGLMLAAGAASGLGLAIAVSRLAYEGGTNGLTVSLTRAWVAVTGLLVLCVVTRRPMRLPPRIAGHCLGLGVLMAMMFYGNVGSVQFIPVGLAALLFYTYPPMVALIHALVLRERLAMGKAMALGLAFLGLALMLGVSFGHADPRGVVLALGAAVATAWNAVWLMRKVRGVDTFVLTLYMAAVAAVVLLGLSLATGSIDYPKTSGGWLGLWAVVALQGTCVPIYFLAIARIGALKSAMISNVQPVVSVIAAFVLYGELLGPVQLLGGVLVLAGVWLMQREDGRRSR